MVGRTLTRARLRAAVYETAGITEHEASALVELVLAEITRALARGETVKLASFGSFSTRRKRGRIGRHPKTGEVALIAPRTVMVFRPSQILKGRIRVALAKEELASAKEPVSRAGRRTARRSGGATEEQKPR